INELKTLSDTTLSLTDSIDALKAINLEEEYLTTSDVAKCLKCSKKEALAYMHRPDFPRLEVGRELKVDKIKFLKYNMEPRLKEETK
ncbi:MAG: hypothetical protein LUD48_03225, partial [Prevotella sp.]|nr:hypothetical protein [Prevotella sp.]